MTTFKCEMCRGEFFVYESGASVVCDDCQCDTKKWPDGHRELMNRIYMAEAIAEVKAKKQDEVWS